MKLTGKCKEDFEKWYKKYIKSNSEKLISNTDVNYFSLLTNSMKYGVYVDFFDSVNLEIYIKKIAIEKYSIYIDNIGHHVLDNYVFFKNLKEARTAAIEKANEIYNFKG
jgi:hypothetical protein